MRLRFRETRFLKRYSWVVSGSGCSQRRRGFGRGSGFVDGDGEGKAGGEEDDEEGEEEEGEEEEEGAITAVFNGKLE